MPATSRKRNKSGSKPALERSPFHTGLDLGQFFTKATSANLQGKNAVLLARASTRQQKYKNNLVAQCASLSKTVLELGANIKNIVSIAASGFDPSCYIPRALQLAKEHNAVIVAESVDRFIRHRDYEPVYNFDLQPQQADLKQLLADTAGIQLFTILAPNSSPEKVRDYQSKRGEIFSSRKARNPCLLKLAKQMAETGYSNNRISKYIYIPRTTIRRWNN